MREIKFRGKSISDNSWVYGDMVRGTAGMFIYEQETNNEILVYPDTIGQYTGIEDMNGREIYDGDIISDGTDADLVEWDASLLAFVVTANDGAMYLIDYLFGEVIGNKYDNPELLEDEEDV